MFKRVLLFTLILAVMLSGMTISFALDPNSEFKDADMTEIAQNDESIDLDDSKHMEWRKIKNELFIDDNELKDEKARLSKLEKELEENYKEANEVGDVELIKELEQRIEKVREQLENLRQETRLLNLKKRELVRSSYTEAEMEKANASEEKIKEEDIGIKTMPVECIFSNAAEFKFDTPPVIKNGRTLIPVRALTEGFGALVSWNEETREVKIEKNEKEIIIIVDTNKAVVGNQEVELDVASQIINSRTYVPLRFILETFGLEVEWDEETETISIDDPEYSLIDPENFVDTVDNQYFPLNPGETFIYEGDSDGELEHVEVYVTGETREVMGIKCMVVRDRVWVDGELEEDTYDWFAQDINGNIWYFGEDSKEIDEGKIVSTKGSWEAGVDGADPGIVMKASPKAGDIYRQEYYENEAEDMAEVMGANNTITIEYGTFENVLKTKEWTPLEPGVIENKYYVSGVGMILEEVAEGGEGRLELIEIKTK